MRERAIATMAAATVALVVVLGCPSRAATPVAAYGIGSPANASAISPLDIDVAVDGTGLPPGRATAQDGAPIYAASCRSCHGERIPLGRWRYATALFDYIRRAMPPGAPRRLSARDLYALTAYLLHAQGRFGASDVVDRDALVRSALK